MYLVYLDTPARRRDAEKLTRMSAPHDPAYHDPVVHRDHLPPLKLQAGKYGVDPLDAFAKLDGATRGGELSAPGASWSR